ncbi:hypothetical protein QR680_005455 [Steinernema hermaphroditum]|uniref:C-type lectin domain-containing protein n=1 Tax=Steinernema hermaphroditum TaxID=289476 RepID=A0AA39HTD5_9BILA|nr:hypothetical protein QR680_005455 [Steinernema hermaphroditum]
MWAFPLFFGLLSLSTASGATCSKEHYEVLGNENCYRTLDGARKRSEARILCQEDGAELVAVDTAESNAAIVELATNATYLPWLGLTCGSATECHWDDGTKMDYSNFAKGNPDLDVGKCVFVALSGAEKGKWRSSDCTFAAFLPICQLRPPTAVCPPGFVERASSKCYKFDKTPTDAQEAEVQCQEANGHLVSLHSAQASDDLLAFLSPLSSGNLVFIGLKYVQANNNSYAWSDKTPLDFEDWTYPFPSNRYGECVAFMASGTNRGKWRNVSCLSKLPYVCEAEASDEVIPMPTTSPEGKCPLQNYFADNGTITSPGFGEYYGPVGECDYHINVALDLVVRIRFPVFDVAEGDFVELVDEGDPEAPIIAKITSGVDPDKWFHTTSNLMLLRFSVSSKGGNAKGWLAEFGTGNNAPSNSTQMPATLLPKATPLPNTIQGTCGGEFNGSATFASPEFPHAYPRDQFCIYTLKASDQLKAKITLGAVDLEPCCSFLKVFDGPSIKSALLGEESGQVAAGEVSFVASGSWMTVGFISHANDKNNTGFWASFVSVE